MAAALGYADCCPACGNGYHWPHRAIVDGGDLTGSYRCDRCGNDWECSYDVNIGTVEWT